MTIAKINEVSVGRYGFQVSGLSSVAALWLADHILKTTGKNVYKTISQFRNKHGLGTAFPEYGTSLFKTM